MRPDATLSLDEFVSRYDVTIPPRDLIILNGMGRDEPFRSGQPYKVVQGGRPG